MNTISRKELMASIIEADKLGNFDDCNFLCQAIGNEKNENGDLILSSDQSEVIEFYI